MVINVATAPRIQRVVHRCRRLGRPERMCSASTLLSCVHTPRSTLAAWAGQAGAALEPLYGARKRFLLECRVLHADETPVALLDPGAGKTRRAYAWACARRWHDAVPGLSTIFPWVEAHSTPSPTSAANPGEEGDDGRARS